MSAQYLRQFSCVVADAAGKGLELNQFRCTFEVRRGDLQTPNSVDVRIFNLSDSTANLLAGTEFEQIQIQAGYDSSYGLIFKGSIKQYRKGRLDQCDTYVDITAADGDEAYNFAPIFMSVKAGSTPGTLADSLLTAMQSKGIPVTKGYAPNWPTNGCVRGRVLYGMARDEARDFAEANDCSWSIQDNALTFIPMTSYVPGPVPVISPATGLIGVPEVTQAGLRLRVLLNPNMKVGQLVKLDSKNINRFRYGLDNHSAALTPFVSQVTKTNADGLYYVMSANHSGDTRGQPWYTDMICLAVDATVPLDVANTALTAISAQSIKRYD